ATIATTSKGRAFHERVPGVAVRAWRYFLGVSAKLAALPIMLMAMISGAEAQVQRAFENLSFEEPSIASCSIGAALIPDQYVPGWHSNHFSDNSRCISYPAPGPLMDIWVNQSAATGI